MDDGSQGRVRSIVVVLTLLASVLAPGAVRAAGASGSSYASVVVGDGPVSYWRLGEGSGSVAVDASGHGSNGTYSGGFTQGVAGAVSADTDTAVGFDGVSANVSVPDTAALRLNGSFSIEFFARLTSFVNTWPGLLVKGSSATADGYLVWYDSAGALHFKRNNIDVATSIGALTSDRFHHFVLTYDGTHASWYRDGTFDRAKTVTYPASAGTTALNLGRGDNFGRDVLDEVALYGQALTATQITNHYTVATTGVIAAPGAPTGVTAGAGNASATVSWTAPSDGGSTITGYRVVSNPGALTVTAPGSALTATVNGLTNGVAYTFTVTATNSIGPGPTSSPSNTVTPAVSTVVPDTVAGDWPKYVHDPAGSSNNASETTISASNAATLAQKWTVSATAAILDQPVVGNGMVYFGDNKGFMDAVDVNTHLQKWSTALGFTTDSCASQGLASTAALATLNGTPTLYVGGGDAALYALNANTGAVLWRTQLGDTTAGAFAWSSPLIANGSVYMGLASMADCPLNQGKLIRLNAATGAIQASVATAPTGCVGGGIWGSPSMDATGDIYFSTGTEATCSSPTPLEISVVRVDPINLIVKGYWHIPEAQQAPDGDFGSVPTIFDAPIPGTSGHLLAIANKNGNFYALDRDNLSAGPVWTLHIAISGASPLAGEGALSPAAYDGQTLYVAGGNTTVNGVACKTAMRAVNPVNGTVVWAHCFSATTDGPVLAPTVVANGVVYVCEGQYLVALDASSGNVLKAFQSSAGFYASPSVAHAAVYAGSLDGKLHVLTLNGA